MTDEELSAEVIRIRTNFRIGILPTPEELETLFNAISRMSETLYFVGLEGACAGIMLDDLRVSVVRDQTLMHIVSAN